jgi:phage-related protein
MPAVRIVLFREPRCEPPVEEWLDRLPRKVRAKAIALFRLLEEQGHELRRPVVENLGDDIYELRIIVERQQYRILFFFHGREAVVLTNGLKKESKVPEQEIALAKRRQRQYLEDPKAHSKEWEVEDEDEND